MAAQATLTLNDGQAAPAAHNFLARGVNAANVAKWLETVSGIAIGNAECTSRYLDNPSDPMIRVELRVRVPVMETISGADNGYTAQPRVAFTGMAKLQLEIPRRMGLADRKNLLAYAKNFASHAVVTSMVHDFDPPY